MSWTDKSAIEHIKKIRDIFKVDNFIETGTFMGINAELHSKNFKFVFTCEKVLEYWNKANERLNKYDNVFCYKSDSTKFLNKFSNSPKTIFYLDAHFYDPELPKNKKFVVLDELKALKGQKNAIIIIHDFDNNLGHITYDGQPLDFELLKKDLLNINPNFKFYTNELSSCNPVTLNYKDIIDSGLNLDAETLDNLEYAWSCPRLTYRGILYCLPKEVKIDGLKLIK
ncbi:MAG: hypothetical protein PHS80_15820 [Methanothrix sp.]|nr:hypothetical protein [Methanothrix sp.]